MLPVLLDPVLVHRICEAFVNNATIADLAIRHALPKNTIERIIRANMQRLCMAVVDQGAKQPETVAPSEN